MTSNLLPDAGSLVEITASHKLVSGIRVVQTDGPVLILSLALAAVPPEGATVTVRWPAGPRGRYAQTGAVVGVDENRVAIELTGDPVVEQQRHFVRGGGGEQVMLRRPGQPDANGLIRDLSEQGIRAHFEDVDLHDDDKIELCIQLGPDVVEVGAVASKVASLRQSIPQHGPVSVEIVAVFTAGEKEAQVIRRYVLHQQLLARQAKRPN